MLQLDRLTTQEQYDTITAALELIKEPINWCQGEWKCEFYIPDTNECVYQYCLEGAINQAAVNLYGWERAEELGAATEYWQDDPNSAEAIQVETGETLANTLSFDDLVWKLYEEELREGCPMIYATNVDEGNHRFAAMNWQDIKGRKHEEVLDLLRRKQRSLKVRLGK